MVKLMCLCWYQIFLTLQLRCKQRAALTLGEMTSRKTLSYGALGGIESSLPFTLDGDETWLSMFPTNVFTKRPTG